MPGRLVFMENAMSDSTINDRNRSRIGSFGGFGITTINRANGFLNGCSGRRSLTGVVLSSGFRLSRPFFRLV